MALSLRLAILTTIFKNIFVEGIKNSQCQPSHIKTHKLHFRRDAAPLLQLELRLYFLGHLTCAFRMIKTILFYCISHERLVWNECYMCVVFSFQNLYSKRLQSAQLQRKDKVCWWKWKMVWPEDFILQDSAGNIVIRVRKFWTKYTGGFNTTEHFHKIVISRPSSKNEFIQTMKCIAPLLHIPWQLTSSSNENTQFKDAKWSEEKSTSQSLFVQLCRLHFVLK